MPEVLSKEVQLNITIPAANLKRVSSDLSKLSQGFNAEQIKGVKKLEDSYKVMYEKLGLTQYGTTPARGGGGGGGDTTMSKFGKNVNQVFADMGNAAKPTGSLGTLLTGFTKLAGVVGIAIFAITKLGGFIAKEVKAYREMGKSVNELFLSMGYGMGGVGRKIPTPSGTNQKDAIIAMRRLGLVGSLTYGKPSTEIMSQYGAFAQERLGTGAMLGEGRAVLPGEMERIKKLLTGGKAGAVVGGMKMGGTPGLPEIAMGYAGVRGLEYNSVVKDFTKIWRSFNEVGIKGAVAIGKVVPTFEQLGLVAEEANLSWPETVSYAEEISDSLLIFNRSIESATSLLMVYGEELKSGRVKVEDLISAITGDKKPGVQVFMAGQLKAMAKTPGGMEYLEKSTGKSRIEIEGLLAELDKYGTLEKTRALDILKSSESTAQYAETFELAMLAIAKRMGGVEGALFVPEQTTKEGKKIPGGATELMKTRGGLAAALGENILGVSWKYLDTNARQLGQVYDEASKALGKTAKEQDEAMRKVNSELTYMTEFYKKSIEVAQQTLKEKAEIDADELKILKERDKLYEDVLRGDKLSGETKKVVLERQKGVKEKIEGMGGEIPWWEKGPKSKVTIDTMVVEGDLNVNVTKKMNYMQEDIIK